MQVVKDILLSDGAVKSYVVIGITFALLIIFTYLRNKYRNKSNIKGYRKTIGNIIFDILRFIIIGLAIIWILSVNGVNVTSVVAGLGIASAIIGLALQDLLKDLFMGFHILSDSYYAIGDYVEYEDTEGYISHFSLTSTRITDIADGSVYYISNRNITKIKKLPPFFYFSIPTPYGADSEELKKLFGDVCRKVKLNQTVENCELLGPDELGSSAVMYKLKITCNLKFKYENKRLLIAAVIEEYEKYGFSIPYDTITITNGAVK